MNNSKILLFSVFLGDQYNNYLPIWIKYNAQSFYPDNCDILLLTDQCKRWKKYETNNIKIEQFNNIYKNREDCMVNKLKWLLEIIEKYAKNYQRIAFIQSNVFCSRLINQDNLPIPFDKITLCEHAVKYARNCSVYKNLVLDTKSKFYIQPDKYPTYIQTCLILGNTSVFKKMLKDTIKLQGIDIAFNYYAPWYDESYINRWLVDNRNLVNIECLLISTNHYDPGVPEPFNVVQKRNLNKIRSFIK